MREQELREVPAGPGACEVRQAGIDRSSLIAQRSTDVRRILLEPSIVEHARGREVLARP